MSVGKVLNATAHTTCWTNGRFHPLMRTGGRSSTGCATFDGHCTGYDGLEEFARERDSFLWPLPARDGKGSPQYAAFAAEVNRTLSELAVVPSLASRLSHGGLKPVDIRDAAALALETETLSLKFDSASGAISSLVQKSAQG